MYVCLCLGVTDREITQAIREGACTLTEIMRCSGAGTRCGACKTSIASLVSSARAEAPESQSSPSRRLPVLPLAPSAA